MPSNPRALSPEEIQEAIRALLARNVAAGILAVGATVTGVLAKYDGDLIRCPACAGAGRFERDGEEGDVLLSPVVCTECDGRGHLNGEPVELLRVVNGKLVEHLVHGQPMPLPLQED